MMRSLEKKYKEIKRHCRKTGQENQFQTFDEFVEAFFGEFQSLQTSMTLRDQHLTKE